MKQAMTLLLCLTLLPIIAGAAGKTYTPPATTDHALRLPNVGHTPYTGTRSTPTLVDQIPLSAVNATGYCWGITYDWERDCLWVTQWNNIYTYMYAIQKTSPCVKVDSVLLGSGVPTYRLGIGYGGSDVMYMAGYNGQIYTINMTTGTGAIYRATPWSTNEALGFNGVDDAVYSGDWTVNLCGYAQPAQTGSWSTWSLSSVSGLSGAHSGSASPEWLFTVNEDAVQAYFFQHSLTNGVPNTTPDSIWDLPAGMTMASTADCAFDGQYVYVLDQSGPDMIWVFDVGIQAGPATFWDFEDGWQGWTHTSAQIFPAAWGVQPSGLHGSCPDPGDSSMWIDSDATGVGGVADTALSPVVVPPAGMQWLKYGYFNYGGSGSYHNELHAGIKYFTGGVWNVIELAYYPMNVASGPAWDSADVSVYAASDSVQVYFFFDDLSTWGYYAAFDNVGLYPAPGEDVGVSAILEPVGIYSLNDVVAPKARVQNYGDLDETFPVIFTMTRNATLVYADTVAMTLVAGAVDTAVFGSYTFTQAGAYDIVSYTELVGDQNPANDTADAIVSIFEWVEDFEASNGGFVSDPVTGAWEWGVPTSGPGAAYSGTKLWATVLAGDYINYANWKLTSQDDYVATENNPHIFFYHWYNIENGWDGGNVKYSTDGITWLLLQPVGGYDGVASTANSGIPGESCFTGVHTAWEAEEIIIPVNSGQTLKLRFHFGTDGSVVYPGWYIDDLAGLGLTYVGIAEQPGDETPVSFGFAPMANPTRDYAAISYAITKPGMVSLKVYDRTGRLVETLVNNTQNAGTQTVTWDSRKMSNGVYFLRLEADNQTAVHKLILVK